MTDLKERKAFILGGSRGIGLANRWIERINRWVPRLVSSLLMSDVKKMLKWMAVGGAEV